MNALLELWPWLAAMAVLIVCSAFFSASEAALFYLRPADRRELADGNRAQRVAAHLLNDPERLLSAVLFWNLVINMTYFAVVAVAGLLLRESSTSGGSAALGFALGSLLVIIFCSEMLPKSVAVLSARRLSALLGIPLAITVRIVDPLMPVLRTVNLLSRRLIAPRFETDAQLRVADLERAVELSLTDANLVKQEQAVLGNIVMLSDIRVDEWMRPRTQFTTFAPPVSLADLDGQMTPSGYLLITEPDSEEVASSVNLRHVTELPDEHLEYLAEPVLFSPWSTTVAAVLQNMQTHDREVAAIVNEFGETIGILTYEDLLDTVFTYSPSRSKRLLDENPVHYIAPGKWLVAGVTSVRRLSRLLNIELPPSKSVTVAGFIQEALQRLAEPNDQGEWGPFHFRVLEVRERGNMLIEITERRNTREDDR